MKRVSLALLGILVIAGFCMAQAVWEQHGMASQEMQLEGFKATATHSSGFHKARVTNTITGDEIEVIIVGRIPPSDDRIIDLSPAAALALNINGSGPVIVAFPAPPLPVPIPPPLPLPTPVEPEPVHHEPVYVAAEPPIPVPPPLPPPAPVEPEPVHYKPVAEEPPPQPLNITIHNYIVIPDSPPEERRERPARRNVGRRATAIAEEQIPEEIPEVAVQPDPPPEPQPLPPFPAQPPEPWPRPPLADHMPPPVHIDDIVIIPGLPNPRSERIYRIQVGAYSGLGSASLAVRQVEAAGFIAVQETHGGLFRVFVEGIPSWNVQASVQRLAALGFTHMWIRE